MSFLEDIQKQPRHVREIMFVLCVVITISLVGLVWFRSFEEDLFVMLNPSQEEQERFYADRQDRTPVIYANVTKALTNLQATLYDALGFLDDYPSKEKNQPEEEYQGEVNKLPLSGDK